MFSYFRNTFIESSWKEQIHLCSIYFNILIIIHILKQKNIIWYLPNSSLFSLIFLLSCESNSSLVLSSPFSSEETRKNIAMIWNYSNIHHIFLSKKFNKGINVFKELHILSSTVPK